LYSWGASVNGYPAITPGYLVEKNKKAISTGSTSDIFVKPYYTASNHTVYQINLLTNYELNGSTYDTVRVFHVGADRCGFQSKIPTADGKSDYYFAKNYGLIKLYNMSFKASNGTPINQTWSLIRKNIVQ
jgi:hypothetical protein